MTVGIDESVLCVVGLAVVAQVAQHEGSSELLFRHRLEGTSSGFLEKVNTL